MRLVTILILVLWGAVFVCRANTDVSEIKPVMRAWTYGNGVVLTGQLVGVNNGLVTLGLPGGMQKIIALKLLSSQDVAYLSAAGAVKPTGPGDTLPPKLRAEYERLKLEVARIKRLNEVGRVSAVDAADQIHQVVNRFTNNYWTIESNLFPAKSDSHCQTLLQELDMGPFKRDP